MFEKIQTICNHLQKRLDDDKININNEIYKKFEIFRAWLLENGTIIDKNIKFPVAYGPFNKIGCESIEEIKENQSFLLIPKQLIIISSELNYIDKYITKIKEELSENDLSLIYLVLFLYLENKNSNSFYKPYLDTIFIKEEIIYDKLNEKNVEELNDELTIKSMEKMINKIEEIYNLIKQCEKFEEIKKEDFIECYYKVLSRKIELNGDIALIPLLDLFYKDNSMNLKYEIYDSENMVFKYTSLLNNEIYSNFDLFPTNSNFLPYNKPSYNKLIPYIVNYDDDEEEDIEIKINKNDYFSISTSKNNLIKKNEIICNRNELGNKKLLKNNGYCLLYNKNDYLVIKLNFKRGEILLDRYLKNIFKENYLTENDDPIYNNIKIKIYFNYISTDLLNYFRFIYFNDTKKNPKEYFKYKFILQIEISIIYSSIEFLEKKLNIMESKYPFEIDFNNLEKEIFHHKVKNYFKTNLIIFRLSQIIIIRNQINLLKYILNIMKKYKVNGYHNLYDYLNTEKISNDYDTKESTNLKILRFIASMSKSIDLNE